MFWILTLLFAAAVETTRLPGDQIHFFFGIVVDAALDIFFFVEELDLTMISVQLGMKVLNQY